MDTVSRRNIIVAALICSVIMVSIDIYTYVSKGLKEEKKYHNVNIIKITDSILKDSDAIAKTIVVNGVNNAKLEFSMNKPKDKIIYNVTVENTGDGDAKVDDIVISDNNMENSNSKSIIYTIEKISEGAIIKAGEKASFTVTVLYAGTSLKDSKNIDKSISLSLKCSDI